MRKFRYRLCYILAVLWIIVAIPISRSEVILDQTLTLFKAPPENAAQAVSPPDSERMLLMERLRSGEFGKPEDFQTRASLRLKTAQRPAVLDVLPLMLPAETLVNAASWQRQDNLFFWRPRATIATALASSTLTLPLATSQTPAKLTDYDQLWVEFTETPSVAACQPDIKLAVVNRPYGQQPSLEKRLLAQAIQHRTLRPLLTLDVRNAEWRRKDYVYLTERMLGLAPDAIWRYAQDGKNVVIQRRLRQDLSKIAALDLALTGSTPLERANVMVSVDHEDTAGQIIEYEQMSYQPLPANRNGVRINLQETLAMRFPRETAENAVQPGRHRFYLQEIFVFLPGDEAQIVAAKPLSSVTLWEEAESTVQDSPGSKDTVRPLDLSNRVEAVSATHRRWVVDLGQLTQNGETTLEYARLLLTPADPATLCAIQVNSIQLVSVYQSKVPVFIEAIEDLSRRWGGPFLNELPQDNQTEAFTIQGYLPFAAFTQASKEFATIQDALRRSPEHPAQPLPTSYSLPPYQLESRTAAISSTPEATAIPPSLITLRLANGATLNTAGFNFQMEANSDTLILQGYGDVLTLNWPLQTEVGPETRFFLGMSSDADPLARAELLLTTADGASLSYLIIPNQALKLALPSTQLRQATLRLVPANVPYRLELREAVLFVPTMLNFAQAYQLKLPVNVALTPQPQDLQGETTAIVTEEGEIRGLLLGRGAREALRWTTLLTPALVWGRGILLQYHLPWTRASNDPCQLTLTLIGDKARLERDLCLQNQAGTIFIPFADWLVGAEQSAWGALQAIQWTLHTSGDPAASAAPAIDLEFAIEGMAYASAAEQIRLAPLFRLGEDVVYAGAEQGSGETPQSAILARQWLPLAPETLQRLLSADVQPEQNDHRWFRLERIVAEPKPPLPLERWLALIQQPEPPLAPSRWPKLLLLALSGAALVWLWRKGWIQPFWRLGKQALYLTGAWLLTKLKRGLLCIGHSIARHERWVHALIGVAALVGVIGAGQLGLSFSGAMSLLAALSIVVAAQHFWRQPIGTETGSNGVVSTAWPKATLGITLLGVGLSLWSLGFYGPTAQAFWGCLPLLSATYWQLDGWRRGFPKMVVLYAQRRKFFVFAAWTLATFALYVGGLAWPTSQGENYYFTFGGMAAVLVWRNLLLSLEPRLRQWRPVLAGYVYDGAGSLYFSGALTMLVCTALLLAVKLEPIAEQVAIVVYYCLVVGTVKEFIALRRQRVEQGDNTANQTSPPAS